MINHDDLNYLFFENYSYRTGRGKISYGVLNNGKLVDVADALICGNHLSYPFLIKEGEDVFMIPECSENKRLEVWRAVHFPDQWELYATAFEGQCVGDATIFKDHEGIYWLFLNKSTDPFFDLCSELYIYKIDGLKLNNIVPHEKNPVVIDSRYARNAGNIYYDQNIPIRPSQYNTNSIYGHGLNISKITNLTLTDYSEQLITRVKPEFKKGLMGVHHLVQFDSGFILDACFRFKF